MTSLHPFNEIPGPAPVRNPLAIWRLFEKLNDNALPVLGAWVAEYGSILKLEVAGDTQLVVTEPAVLREMLVTRAASFHKDKDYTDTKRGLARFLGNGLLTSNGEFWKRQRKLVAPALHIRRIETYAEAMTHYADKELQSWQDGREIDVAQAMMRITLQIVARTLFSMDVEDEIAVFSESMDIIQRFNSNNTLLPAWVPTAREMKARQAQRDLDRVIYGMIADWRNRGEDRGDLLSMLLLAETEDGQRMSDKQARDEALTLFLAGHETTANSLSWTWYLLAQNPDIEARFHAELDSVLEGRSPQLADLKNLPYTEMIVKESMRLYPPAWAYSRVTIEETELGGYQVPKGVVVAALPYFTHHDPRFWDEPERFMPERFSAEQEAEHDRYAYLPFGAGPRVCIGNNFAMMEAQLILASIGQRYRLHLRPGQQVGMSPMITLTPRGAMSMRLEARQPLPVAQPSFEV